MNEWGVNEGGVDRCVYVWELIVVKIKFGFLLWLELGYNKATIKVCIISASDLYDWPIFQIRLCFAIWEKIHLRRQRWKCLFSL